MLTKSKESETEKTTLEEQTRSLYALVSDWHTISKDLADMEDQFSRMLCLYDTFVKGRDAIISPDAPRLGCDQALGRLLSDCQFYRRWSICYRDRTSSRIGLVSFLLALPLIRQAPDSPSATPLINPDGQPSHPDDK